VGGRYIGYTDTKATHDGMVTDIRVLNIGDTVFMTVWDRAPALDDHEVDDAFVFPATMTNKEQTGLQKSGQYSREDWRIDFGETVSLYFTIENGEFRDRIPAVFNSYESAAAYVLSSYKGSLEYLTEELEGWKKRVAHREATLTVPIELRTDYRDD